MTAIANLWLPIVVSAVGVFIASSLIHMVIRWHNPDYGGLANQDEVRALLNAGKVAPGEYYIPHCPDMKDMGKPDMVKRFEEGPAAVMIVRPSGMPAMGGILGQWFAYCVATSVICAYVAGATFPNSVPSFGAASRLVGAIAFMGYAGAYVQLGIWWGKPWGSVARYLADGAIFAAITGATFAWLWPK
jgi:hypothetical protein